MNSSTPQGGGFHAPGVSLHHQLQLLAFPWHLRSSMNQTFSLEVGEGGYLESFPLQPPNPPKKQQPTTCVQTNPPGFSPRKNQGLKNCFHVFSRRNYHGPWNSNRPFCRFILLEWFRNPEFIPLIYQGFYFPKGGCLGFLPPMFFRVFF